MERGADPSPITGAPAWTGGDLAVTRRAIGSFLRAARQAMHLSIEQLSARSNGEPYQLSSTAISYIEHGRSLPSLQTLIFYERTLLVQPEEILEHLRTATSVPPDLAGLSFSELLNTAMASFRKADYSVALACLHAAQHALLGRSAADDRARMRLRLSLQLRRVVTLRRLGAMRAARTVAEQIIEASESIPEVQSLAYSELAYLSNRLNSPVLAADAARRASETSSKCRPRIKAAAIAAQAELSGERLDFEEARRLYLRARTMYAQDGDTDNSIVITGNIGYTLLQVHMIREAAAWIGEALEMARANDRLRHEAVWLVGLARAALEDSRLEDGTRFAESALQIARRHEDRLTVFQAEWLLHKLAVAGGCPHRDSARMGRLRRLLPGVAENRNDDDVREFVAALRAGQRDAEH